MQVVCWLALHTTRTTTPHPPPRVHTPNVPLCTTTPWTTPSFPCLATLTLVSPHPKTKNTPQAHTMSGVEEEYHEAPGHHHSLGGGHGHEQWHDALEGELTFPLTVDEGLRQRKPTTTTTTTTTNDDTTPPAPAPPPPARPPPPVRHPSEHMEERAWPIESRRRLGGFETFFQHTVPYGLGLIYYIVDFEGPPDTDLLAEAMRLQVKKHPNLRSRLKGDYLETVPFEACPEVEVAYIETEDVVGHVEKAMKGATKIKAGLEPYLWQLALHHTPSSESHHLLFYIHHAISDGDSILRCFQALVEGMAALSPLSEGERAKRLDQVESLPQLPSADVQLYPNYNGWYMLYHWRALLKELWKVLVLPKIPTPCKLTPCDKARTTRISSFTLDAPDFKRLLKTCKAQQTSMTGALAAACAQAMQEYITGPQTFKLKVEILVNFRGKAAATTKGSADSHQLYAAPMDVMLQAGNVPATALDFWAAARQTKGEIEYFVSEPHMIVDTLEFFYVLGHHPISMPLFRAFGRSFRQGRQKAISISNLGMTDKLYQQAGPWKLGRMQMGIDELMFGHSIFVAVASHEGRLNFTISYIDPIVSRTMAEDYGQALVRNLIDACPPAELDVPPTPQTPVSLTAKPKPGGSGGGSLASGAGGGGAAGGGGHRGPTVAGGGDSPRGGAGGGGEGSGNAPPSGAGGGDESSSSASSSSGAPKAQRMAAGS